jgi:alpha-tubulin suppressor-like RCC1 family protein
MQLFLDKNRNLPVSPRLAKLPLGLLIAFFAGLFFCSGCFRNGDSILGPQPVENQATPLHNNPQAQLNISIKHSHELQAAIRAADTARAVFELKLVNYGNSLNPITLMRKSADVIDNQVTVSFTAVPVVSTLVSMTLEGATYEGAREFHAGIDLKPGENNIELVASGSAAPEDVKARAAIAAIGDFAAMQSLPAALFANLDQTWQALSVADQTSSTKLFDAFKTRVAATKITAFAAGETHSLILRDDGTLAAFGSNVYGQLGKSGSSFQLERKYIAFHQPIAKIAAGSDFSLLLGQNGKVYACGNNADGQLGTTGIGNSAYPLEVAGIPIVSDIFAGYGNALALDAAGNLYGWGRNNMGQLGQAPTTSGIAVPVQMATNVKQAAVGLDFILVLKNDGTVWGIGNDEFIQLAVDLSESGNYSAGLVQIADLSDVAQVAAGGTHCLAVTTAGNVYGWGSNLQGQAGLGATQVPEGPTLIAGLSGIAQVAAGKEFSLFRTSTKTIWGTGVSSAGQLADKSSGTNVSVPVQLAALSGVNFFTCGGSHALAFSSEALAWGANEAGQCGNGLQSPEDEGLTTPVARALSW